MDNTERETHDFMNVDSFSQLPFLRPAPPSKEKAIRLFGQEFCDSPDSNSTETLTTTNNNVSASEQNTNKDANDNNTNNIGESSRRFECHYCCRNFPTSQALGGHQNAHKRERQHAKRHLQSTLSDAHNYNFMNYRFGSTAMSSYSYSSYPTWNSNSSNATTIGNTGGTGRFYGSSSSHPQLQPINGSPLGMWRIPTTTTTHSQTNPIFNREPALPLFAGQDMVNARMGPSGSQNRFAYDPKPSVNDHVSLDLHL